MRGTSSRSIGDGPVGGVRRIEEEVDWPGQLLVVPHCPDRLLREHVRPRGHLDSDHLRVQGPRQEHQGDFVLSRIATSPDAPMLHGVGRETRTRGKKDGRMCPWRAGLRVLQSCDAPCGIRGRPSPTHRENRDPRRPHRARAVHRCHRMDSSAACMGRKERLRHTSARVWGELTSISVEGGAATVHGLVGPFERDFQMSMDLSPRDELVFALSREGPHELWMAKLR